jgi:hypothetical protein
LRAARDPAVPRKPPVVLLNLARASGARLCAMPRGLAWTWAAAWYGLIWLASSRPGGVEPTSLAWIVLSNSAHAPLFGLWAVSLSVLAPRERGWPALTPRACAAILAAVLVGGLADELHQHYLSPGRDFSVLDLGTDVLGAALSLALVAHVSSGVATPAGLLRRLALAAAGSFAAGAVATFLPSCFPGVGWL